MYPDLKLEDIKIGMRVRDYQLNSIYNVGILLVDTVNSSYYIEGTRVFIGNTEILEHHRVKDKCRNMLVIHNIPDFIQFNI